MNRILNKILTVHKISLIPIVYLFTSYDSSVFVLQSLAGSALIIGLGYWTWKKKVLMTLGIEMNVRTIFIFLVMTLLLTIAFHYLIGSIASSRHLQYSSPVSLHGLISPVYFHTIGQTLNEEMVLGALLLYAVRSMFKRTHPLVIAAGVALIFSVFHFVFYRWLTVSTNEGVITLSTLFVLFAVGVLRNSLILKTGHIGYAWSIHLGFNWIFFCGGFQNEDGSKLNEPGLFNAVLGSPQMIVLAFIMLALCAALFFLQKQKV